MFGEAVLLGLSTGTFCAVYCAPVAIPFLFSEKLKNGKQNAMLVILFMIGRLIGYIAVGITLGIIGSYAVSYIDPEVKRKFAAFAYTFIGLMLALTGLMHNFPGLKICRAVKKVYKPERGAFLYGLLTGVNFCPPFFAAASRVFGGEGAFGGALYFLLFYLGTSVYFLPLLGIHFLKKHMETIRMVSRITMILLGLYFFLFLGFLTVI